MRVRVLLADDHKIVREGLRSLLEKLPDVEIVAEAGDGEAAVRLTEEMLPNVVIMDIGMPGLNGIEATRQVVAKAPGTKVVALSMHSNLQFVIEMLSAGASAYLPKDCAFDELSTAVRAVVAGGTYLSPAILDAVIGQHFHHFIGAQSSAFSVLSTRERQVLQLLAEGKSAKDIAEHLNLSVKTVGTHRERIMYKLNLRSIAELTKYAIREGVTYLDL